MRLGAREGAGEVKPLYIDLFAGCFGWGCGFVAEGYHVIGFDLVHEDYHGPVPEGCELILHDREAHYSRHLGRLA